MLRLSMLVLLGALAACSPTITYELEGEGMTLTGVVVETSCGQCQLGLEGKGCDLAIRVDGEAMYVDGSSIDDHGDAHAEDGLCNAVHHAKVSGEVVDGRFVASSFELVDADG